MLWIKYRRQRKKKPDTSFTSTSFALYREEDRVEDQGLNNKKDFTFFILKINDQSQLNPFRKVHLFLVLWNYLRKRTYKSETLKP